MPVWVRWPDGSRAVFNDGRDWDKDGDDYVIKRKRGRKFHFVRIIAAPGLTLSFDKPCEYHPGVGKLTLEKAVSFVVNTAMDDKSPSYPDAQELRKLKRVLADFNATTRRFK